MPRIMSYQPQSITRLLLKSFIIAAIFLTFCIFIPSFVIAAQRVIIVKGSNSSVYEQFARDLQEHVSKKSQLTTIKIINVAELDTTDDILNRDNTDIYVAAGIAAADAVIKINGNVIKILSLIPDSVAEEKYQKNILKCPLQTCKILPLDQPVKRQLHILHLALPKAKNLLILDSKARPSQFKSSIDEAAKLGLAVKMLPIESNDTLVAQLRDALPKIDVLLALPNNSIFNSTTARPILLTTYKFGVPIFSYSQSFIDAGAVIGVFSTPEQYAQHTAEIVIDGMSGFKQETVQILPPKYFTIGENRSVAESLNLKLPDIESLQIKLRQQQQ